MMGHKLWGGLALVLVAASTTTVHAQEWIFKSLPADRLEKFLKDQKIEFKKSTAPPSKEKDVKDETTFYDLQRDKFQVRLSSFGGKDLMLDCVFGPLSLEGINRWNVQAKFSRASLQKGAKGDALSILEYNLDLSGGATEETLKQYLARFDQELKDFDTFVLSSATDTKILTSIPNERIETILKTLNVTWDKKPGTGDGPTVFDFEIDKQSIRLRNYGGKEILVAAKFAPLNLEAVNEYNLSRKFVRAAQFKTKDGQALTVLEAAYDCEPGVSEAMVRHFLLAFVEDVKNFNDFAQKQQKTTAQGK